VSTSLAVKCSVPTTSSAILASVTASAAIFAVVIAPSAISLAANATFAGLFQYNS